MPYREEVKRNHELKVGACINVKMIGYRGSDRRSATEGRTDKVMCRGRLSSTNAADYVELFDLCSTISFYVFN